MYYGLIALLTRALRLDARQLRNHLFRLAFVGFIYLALLWATIESGFRGAPGLQFFSNIAFLNLLFITCAGIGYFASAITEEKEEETIGLLQMAGLNHVGILLGKSTSRLIQVALLLIVQFPFMLLAVTLGGVTTHQIIAAYVDILAFTVLLANVALVCSVVCQRGGNAAALTTILIVLYSILPIFATLGLRDLQSTGWTKAIWWKAAILTSLEWLEKSCVFYQLQEVMQTGFNERILTRQVISNVVAGIICFGLAWLLFGPSINNATTGGVTRGPIRKSTSRVKFLSPGRCWNNPLIWKDYQFIGGGYALFVGKLLAYATIFAVIVGVSLYTNNWLELKLNDVGYTYFSVMLLALFIEACLYASRIFHEEIRLQTMSSLLMLPHSIPYIGYSKAIGCVMGLAPAAICLAGAAVLLPDFQFSHLAKLAVEPWFWATIMVVLVFLHLVALLSLFVKWGALPLAIFLMGPVSICCPVWQLFFVAIGPSGLQDVWGKLPATITVWFLTGLVCFVFQMMIAARLQELGTK